MTTPDPYQPAPKRRRVLGELDPNARVRPLQDNAPDDQTGVGLARTKQNQPVPLSSQRPPAAYVSPYPPVPQNVPRPYFPHFPVLQGTSRSERPYISPYPPVPPDVPRPHFPYTPVLQGTSRTERPYISPYPPIATRPATLIPRRERPPTVPYPPVSEPREERYRSVTVRSSPDLFEDIPPGFWTDSPDRTPSPIRTPSPPPPYGRNQIDPAGYISRIRECTVHNLGPMTVLCSACKALHFKDENPKRNGNEHTFEQCCKHGDVRLPYLPVPPEPLRTLLEEQNPRGKEFRTHIRQYNAAFAFTSCRFQDDTRLGPQAGNKCFQIHGELYHLTGPLEPHNPNNPEYAQVYFYDPEDAAAFRERRNPNLNRTILNDLTTMLHAVNPHIHNYRTAREVMRTVGPEAGDRRVVVTPQLRLVLETGADKRRENLPTASEVALIIPEEWAERPCFRDIILTERRTDGNEWTFHRIDQNNAAYMGLHYVLLFPTGSPGWHWALNLAENTRKRQDTGLKQRQYYRFYLHIRNDEFNPLHRACRLFQQYVVDAWAVCDANKLKWIMDNQDTLRTDLYKGFQDNVRADDAVQVLPPEEMARLRRERQQRNQNPNEPRIDGPARNEGLLGADFGKPVVLPSSYIGGDRFMSQCYQDSMALVGYFGKPTFFITATANPNWPEIKDNLLPGQTANDRPDLICRVFHLKAKRLLRYLRQDQVFGKFNGFCWTIEYQKRSLPHIHCLVFTDTHNRHLDPDWIDSIIRAELPTPDIDPDGSLATLIKSTMIHGPCGPHIDPKASCMQDERRHAGMVCDKEYPKSFRDETVVNEDGAVQYRRRDIAHWDVPIRGGRTVRCDNRWVVPYSPFLCKTFQCHINVELCSSIMAIKYMHKYIYKGHDISTLQVENKNEVLQHLHGRYIAPPSSVWSLMEFPVHQEFPPVKRLAIHLPDEHTFAFKKTDSSQQVREKRDRAKSTLMGFFEYYQENPGAVKLLYTQFAADHVWHPQSKRWTPRKQGARSIGRMYHINPFAGERYYLRLLLTVVPGPSSFEELRSFQDHIYPTFKDACRARGLLQDDGEWVQVFEEASVFSTGRALRQLFVMALTQGAITDPLAIWTQFREHICDDLAYRIRSIPGIPETLETPYYDYGLYLLSKALQDFGQELEPFRLPPPQFDWGRLDGNVLIQTELDYNPVQEELLRIDTYAQLNEDQRTAYDTILEKIETDPEHCHFFIQGPAGTGKTFLYKAICHHFHSKGDIVLCVASSGIAALLLPGGTTAHSRFRIPINVTPVSICNVPKQSQLAQLLRKTNLIIWDEIPMTHKYAVMAVDRSLRDVRSCHAVFGGIPTLFGGDFAQILPVIKKGTRGSIVTANIQRATFWDDFSVLHLRRNMRVRTGAHNTAYADWIGRLPYDTTLYGPIRFPDSVRKYEDVPAFIDSIFPTAVISRPGASMDFYKRRAILTLRNETATALNGMVMENFPGNLSLFFAADTAENNDGETLHYLTPEMLRDTNPSGLPPGVLSLAVGVPIMLLRNLYPKEGLCNGTRLLITRITRFCIEAKILDGAMHGQIRLIPRIILTTTEDEFPFILKRKQFPVRPCFAITVNKSQGQSLDHVGIDLRHNPFAHGQLYVAASRVTDVNNLSILLRPNSETDTFNVVWPEVLLR